MLVFPCPACGRPVQAEESFAGKRVLCPNCNATLNLPTPSGSTAITDGDLPSARGHEAYDDEFNEAATASVKATGTHFVRRMLPYVIVSVLVVTAGGWLIISIGSVRESAARTQSVGNLKQIVVAMHSYHDANKHLPFNGTAPAIASNFTSGSWAFQILPYIDQQQFFDGPKINHGVPGYLCPGRHRPLFCSTGAWTDYAINPWLNDPRHGGVNAPNAALQLIDIRDLRSNTICVGHGMMDRNVYSLATPHRQSTDIFQGGHSALARQSTHSMQDHNSDGDLFWGSPFSAGTLFAFCDGTVRIVPYTLSGGVIHDGVGNGGLAVFLTANGAEVALFPD